jgi:hypothetical protein
MFEKCIPRIAVSIAAAVTMATVTNTSFAASGTGTLVTYHVDGARGLCVRTNPALPGTGWGCIEYDDQLFEEFKNLLLHSYIQGRVCTVAWSKTGHNGNGVVNVVECN